MMTQNQWIQKLRDCAKVHTGGNWALGDLLVSGTNEFGRKSYALACQATGYGRVSLYRIARTAAHFPTHLRLENIAWSTFVLLRPFPLSFLEKFLPTIDGSDLSAKLIREKAVAEYGSDPEPYRKQKIFRHVRLATELCDRIVEQSGKAQVSGAVTQILKDYLAAAKGDGKASAAVAPSDGNEPGATSRHPETSAATEPPRPDYETRRKQQLDAGAQPIKPKPPRKSKLRLQWIACRSKSFVDSERGLAPSLQNFGSQKPTCFATEAGAIAAEEKYFREHGHHEEVVYCVYCNMPRGAYHVKHIYSSEVQNKSAGAGASSKAEESAAVFSHTF